MVSPRRMNRPARVTMNEGRPVRTTTMPLIQPTPAATAKARMMHSHKGQPQITAGMASTTPAAPIIEPTDRSNSPPIISSAAATAMMPSCADTSRKVMMPRAENIPVPRAATAKNRKTRMVPATAPSSGRAISRRASGVPARRSSRAGRRASMAMSPFLPAVGASPRRALAAG